MKVEGLITRNIQNCLNNFPENWIDIDAFELAENQQEGFAATYKTTSIIPWEIAGFDLPLENLSVFIDSHEDEGEFNEMRVEGQINFEKKDINISGVLVESGVLLFNVKQAFDEVPTVFIADNSSQFQFAHILDFLELKDPFEFSFFLDPIADQFQVSFDLRATLKETFCISGTQLCLTNPFVNFNSIWTDSDQVASYSASIGAELSLGKKVYVNVMLSRSNIATLRISGVDDDGLPGPADLLQAIGFEKEGKALADAIESNQFLSAPFLDEVVLKFNLKSHKFLSGTIFGHIEVSHYKVRFSAAFPRLVLSLQLDPDTPIHLADMLKETYPELIDMPTEFKVNRANLQMIVDPLDFQLDMGIADIWETNIGNMEIAFEQLNIRVHFAKDQPVTGRIAAQLTLGGVDFGLSGERVGERKKTGWRFQTRIAHSNPIKLKLIVDELTKEFGLPSADWLPETELNNISLDLNTLKETFEFKARAEIKDKLGPFETVAVDVHLKIDKKEKELPLSIKIDGKLKMETSLIQFKTNFGNKNWFIDANWEKEKDETGLKLLDFVREIDPKGKLDLSNVPDAIEKGLTLQKMAFSYYNETKALSLSATNELGITLKFSLVKSAKVAAILGLKYDRKLNESEVGKSLEMFEKDISFTEAWVLLSWVPDGFTPPKNGDFSKDWPIAIDKMGKGILLSAKMEIKDSATGAFKLLNDAVPNSTDSFQITGQLQFAPFFTKLTLAYSGEINFKTNGDHPLTLKDCAIAIEIGPTKASIGASGILKFYVDELIVESRISFTISTQGIQLDLSTQFNQGVPLFGLRNVQLHSVGFSLGVGFTPPSVRLGAEVEMTFRQKQGVKDYFGLILGFTGPIPTPEYVGMDIAKISLNELIENLEENKGKKSFLPDKMAEIKAFSFVWALNDRTLLPDGSTVNAGVAFHGLLTLNNWNAWFEFQANPTVGVSGRGQLEEINVKGFQLTGNTPDIKRLHYKQGREWLPVSNADRLLPGVKTKPMVMLKGGGALVQFSTYKSPYFLANFEVKVLGVTRAKADIEVTDKGMDFNLMLNVPLFSLDQEIHINSDKTFSSAGSFSAGLNFDVPFRLTWPHRFGNPSTTIRFGISGSYRMEYGKNGAFFFRSRCRFHFLDRTIDGPSIDIPYAPKDFAAVVDVIWDNFRKNVFDNLFDIIVRNKGYTAGGGPAIRTTVPRPAQRRMRRTIAPKDYVPTKLTWMDEALKISAQKAPTLLKSGEPAQRLKKLIIKAEKETKAEQLDIQALFEVINNGHADVISKGGDRFAREIGIIELEILHLKDEKKALENKVRAIFEKDLITYKNQKFKYFDAQLNMKAGLIDDKASKNAKSEIAKIEAKLNIEFSKITDAFDPKKGYQNKAGKWAHVAVTHFKEMVQIELDAKFEMEYLALQKFNQQYTASLRGKKGKKTITINI